jgi:uncharacterized Zn finger protein
MRLNLNNLSKYLDPVILDRGREYLLGGHVLSIEDIGDLAYRAEVEGSELYEVYVELDEEGEVISSDCDCPYDYGPVCKHQAAVIDSYLCNHIASITGVQLITKTFPYVDKGEVFPSRFCWL